MLFAFFIAPGAGVLIGGMIGDRVGRQRIIWISILGPLPFTLILPYADFFWTGILSVVINLVMASAFASILIYAMELVPHRIGLVCGLFNGVNFGSPVSPRRSWPEWPIGSAWKPSIRSAPFSRS
jgi:FSR family fosmidomycin resistance protein-like MFS transporter